MADSKYEFYILNLQTGLRSMPISPLEIKSHKLDSANVFGWTELEQEKRLVLNVYADGATFIVDLMRHEIIELNEKITNQYPIYHIFTAPGATGLVNFSEPDIWRLYNSRGELILTSERRTEANYHYPYANWHQSGSKFLTAYAYDVFELEEGHNFSVFALQGVDIYTHDGIHLINYEAPNDRFFEMVYWYDQELLIHEYSIYKAESDWYYQPIDSRYYLFNEQTGAKRELQAITDIAQINPSFKAVKTRGESYLSQGYMLSTRDNKLYLFTDEYENYLLFVELGEHQYYVRREDSSYFYLNLANSTKVEIDRDSKGQEHWDVEFYFMPKWRLDYTRSNERKSVYIKNYLNY